MSGLQANTGAMNTNGKDTVANSEFYTNEVSSLKSNVEGLMTLWRGMSANEFKQSFDMQAENLTQFGILLRDLGEAVSKGANILNNAEEENASAGAHLF